MNKAHPSILIVEDEEDLRASLVEVFSKEYHVLEASDGEEGLRLALEHTPDLVLTDLMMPRMDGFSLCQCLKEHQDTSHIPLIVITVRQDEETELRGLDLGVEDFVRKPFSVTILKARVRNILETRQRLLDNFQAVHLTSGENGIASDLKEGFAKESLMMIRARMCDPLFGVRELAESMDVSVRTLQMKLADMAGLSPKLLIRKLRLALAKQLLNDSDSSVTDVALSVGIPDLSYFGKCYRAEFGCSPTESLLKNKL